MLEYIIKSSDSKEIAKLFITKDEDTENFWCRCKILPEGCITNAMQAKLKARQHLNHLTDEEIDEMSKLAGGDWNYGGFKSVMEAKNSGTMYALIKQEILFPIERLK